ALNRTTSLAPRIRRQVWFGTDSNAYVYGTKRKIWERIFPMPVEGETVYARSGIGADGNAKGDDASDQAAGLRRRFDLIQRYAGGSVFINKRIANNRRIPLLLAAFPDARFVEIIRDGRAVAYSLSRVDWWPDSHVWWYGKSPKEWAAEGKDPWQLCARNWVEEIREIRRGKQLVPDGRLFEVKYEDFLENPFDAFIRLANFCDLEPVAKWQNALRELSFPDKNEAWRRRLSREEIATIEDVQLQTLMSLDYDVGSSHREDDLIREDPMR
ncbi:MAG: sulfotransferase, partial [Actinomycetota bacterium]|nr:sulfotransferase [Actinomycetota bacterium]